VVIANTYRRRGYRPRTVGARVRRAVRDRNGTGRDWTGRRPFCPPPRRTLLCRRRSWSTATWAARRPCGNRIRRSGDGERCPTARARRPACPVWGRRGTRGRHWCPSTGIPPLARHAGTTSAPCPPSTDPIGRAAPSVPTNPTSVRWKTTKTKRNFKTCRYYNMHDIMISRIIIGQYPVASANLCTVYHVTRGHNN